MEIRLTRRPGQPGTKRFMERYGERLGALWRTNHKLWEMRWVDAKRLGIADRVKD